MNLGYLKEMQWSLNLVSVELSLAICFTVVIKSVLTSMAKAIILIELAESEKVHYCFPLAIFFLS